ncbi:MAG: choice-of-anchor D domain-containing protein, partial [Cyanobacteria bacterium J06627_8]
SPSPLGFGEQEVGTTREEVVTLTNRGDRSIQVQSASLSNDNEFSIASDACSGNSLAAGSSCTITVQFTPQDVGDRSTTLTISDTATGSPRSLSITGTGAMVPRPQILSMEARPATIRSGERTNICYRAVNAQSLSLRNDSTGESVPIRDPDGCASVSPSETTTYTLLAEGRNGESVNQQVRVEVAMPEPDTTSPPVPSPIAPSGNEFVLCSGSSTTALSWSPVVDDSSPVTYTAVLERGSVGGNPTGWTLITQQSTQGTQVNITPFLEKGQVNYRWRVNAQDTAGNVSNFSTWLNFRTCE